MQLLRQNQESFSSLKHYRPFCFISLSFNKGKIPGFACEFRSNLRGKARYTCVLLGAIALSALPARNAAAQTSSNSVLSSDALQELHRNVLAALARKDYATALPFLRKAVDQNDLWAEDVIGMLYRDGHGVTQNYAEAIKLFQKAADQGYSFSQTKLGLMYSDGLGVPKSDDQAAYWYRKAAEQGFALAQVLLAGINMERGEYAEMLIWARKAAEQDNATAEFLVGEIYHQGWGVDRDDVKAARWYTQAANQGYADAKTRLAELQAPFHVSNAPIKLMCEDSRVKSVVSINPAAKTVTIQGGAVLEYKDSATQYVRIADDVVEFGCRSAKTEQDVIADQIGGLVGNGPGQSETTNSFLCLVKHKIDLHTSIWTGVNNGNVTGTHVSSAHCTVMK
jgi:TPR repeat protein